MTPRNKELNDWKQAPGVESELRREFLARAEAAEASLADWTAYADKLEAALKLACGQSSDRLMRMHAEQGLRIVRPTAALQQRWRETVSEFSKKYYDPNHPGFSSRFDPAQKIRAIAKMKPGAVPPPEYLSMKIGGDIYTVEALEEDLKEFSKGPDVIGLEYGRPVRQLVKSALSATTDASTKGDGK